MMLRPATPLSVLFGIAFVLLLLSTLSTPVIKNVPLASYGGFTFGVFGYCGPAECTKAQVGYSTGQDASFTLPTNTRHSLSSILIVHPVACFMTLVCFVMAIASHFHSPSHSSRYLLALLILSFPTLLVTLLAFLVDILLFIPHMGWGGWIVLGATIIIMACALLTCSMRRTLVSRKARQKRLAENAEMNGENFYQQQFAQRQAFQQEETQRVEMQRKEEERLARAESPPPLNGEPKLPRTGTYKTIDDRTPLNPRNSLTRDDVAGVSPIDGRTRRDQSGTRSGSRTPRRSEDAQRPGPPPLYGRGGRGGYSRGGPNARGFYPPRGGYPPRGAYRAGPRGPPPPGWNGDGGYGNGVGMGMGMMAGAGAGMAAGAMMVRGGRGPPPPGYDNRYYDQGQSPYGQDGYYERRGPPGPRYAPGYDRRPSPGRSMAPGYDQGDPMRDPASFGYSGRAPSPGRSLRRGQSPPPPMPAPLPDAPIGTAIELDARSGNPALHPIANEYRGVGLDGDGQMHDLDPRAMSGNNGSYSAGGTYSQMATYNPNALVELGERSPPFEHALPAVDTGAELPVAHQAAIGERARSHSRAHSRGQRSRASSEHYYEDVDPRFIQDTTPPDMPIQNDHPPPTIVPSSLVPRSLKPGRYQQESSHRHTSSLYSANNDTYPDHSTPHEGGGGGGGGYEDDPPQGAQSPHDSETSDFTSISQRGVNPDWYPQEGSSYQAGLASQARAWRTPPPPPVTAGVLDGNPDFAVPGGGTAGRNRARAASAARSAGGGGGGGASGGPYPAAI